MSKRNTTNYRGFQITYHTPNFNVRYIRNGEIMVGQFKAKTWAVDFIDSLIDGRYEPAPIIIKLSDLSESMVECIEDQYPDPQAPHGLRTGKTFIEGTADDLLEVADRVRNSEPCIDWNSDNVAFYERALHNAEQARVRWAAKIETAVRLAQRGSN